MQIIDNFIDSKYSDVIENLLSGKEIAWYHGHCVEGICDERYYDSSVFRHGFILNSTLMSDKAEILKPILYRINEEIGKPINLISASANLLVPNQSLIGKHSIPHVDAGFDDFDREKYKTYTALYYVNDSDGDTILFNEHGRSDEHAGELTELVRVSPKKNRFLMWDSRHYHAAPCCAETDRLVINFNFYISVV